MANTQNTESIGRGETINLLASRKQKALIDRAAEALGMSRSDFLLDMLLDRRYFVLSGDAFSAVRPCSTNP
jgi:uncharacterized protein (DUF1778 family)